MQVDMKILIVTGLYFPEIGGPATHTRMLESILPAHGVEVRVLPFSSVHSFPPILRNIVLVWYIFSNLKGVDLLFCQDAFSCGVPGLFAARMRGVPIIVRIPGDYAWEQARERMGITDSVLEFQHKRYGFFIELLRTLQGFVVRHADHVVVPSYFLERIVKQWAPRKLTVIPNGVDLQQQDLNLKGTTYPKPYILSSSRFIRGKGFEVLISLMKELPAWKLVLVGSGPLETVLKNRAQSEDVTGQVIFTGPLAPEKLKELYADATVFVLNSEFESFSFQVLEALAAGVPTVSTTVGAIPEILESDREGILVEPNDAVAIKAAVESVLMEPKLWEKRSGAGQLKATTFSSERSGEAFAVLFKECV